MLVIFFYFDSLNAEAIFEDSVDGFEDVTRNEARILGHYSDDDRNISKKKAQTEPERVHQARLVVKQAKGKQAKSQA